MKKDPKPLKSFAESPRSNGTEAEQMPKYGVSCLTAIAVAIAWTGIGCCLGLWEHSLFQFLHEWELLQGFFLVGLGAWLLQILRSGALQERIDALCNDEESRPSRKLISRWRRVLIVALVSIGGTSSLIALGFDAKGKVLIFMWLTCAAICTAAGFITVHAMEIIIGIGHLQYMSIRLFRYSPAQTRELKDLVSYFTSFVLIMTVGYGFALAATLYPHWTGSTLYVNAVRVFWPLIYVPTCSVALIYPHFVIHRLIRREKEHTLGVYHRQIDSLLTQYEKLTTSDIDRTNTLAQLFDRINATPNYVLDFGIAIRTFLPIAFNIATLVARAAAK